MKNLKRLMTVLAAVCIALSASAQEKKESKYQPYPYMFIGLQGGAQAQLMNYDFKDLITPAAQVSIGAYFTPVVGARLTGSGNWARGGLKSINKTYDYKQYTGNLDLLINLSNLFTGNKRSVVNVILLGGVGLNYCKDNDDLLALTGAKEDVSLAWADDKLNHNFRAGLQLGFDICRNLDFNIEVGANSNNDRFNSVHHNGDDWSVYALAGLAVKFGHKKVKMPEPEPVVEPEPVWETRIDTVWYDETLYREVEVEETLTRNVKFPLRGADTGPATQLQDIADFVATHTNCAVDVKAYADEETGSPKINMKYSEQRRKNTVDALVERGVPADIITSAAFGDTVQPFESNDDNRVSITTVTGKGIKKEPYTVKKSRTEEKRVRVQ